MDKNKNTCFVMMPIKKKQNDYEDLYKNHLKRLVEHQLVSVKCIRADEDPTIDKSKIEEIQDRIKNCTFAIADISEKNPNVYYEIGFAKALGKSVILIKNKHIGKLPFDIQALDVLTYDRDKIGYNDINRQIIASLEKAGLGHLVKKTKGGFVSGRNNNDTIVGKWAGCYWVKEIKHSVELYIDTDKFEEYSALCFVDFEINGAKYRFRETMRYNHKLTSLEWRNSDWVEFIGTTCSTETENRLDYWMDAYAINKDSNGDSLHIKVWDNVNKEKQDVLFERIS
jgi:hypothetical protein